MEQAEFLELAKNKFGDKVVRMGLNLKKEDLEKINNQFNSHISQEDLDEYGEWIWLKGEDCPECGVPLLGLLGSFEWGLAHGYGCCSHCNKVEFKYYHYLGKEKVRLTGLAITGFA